MSPKPSRRGPLRPGFLDAMRFLGELPRIVSVRSACSDVCSPLLRRGSAMQLLHFRIALMCNVFIPQSYIHNDADKRKLLIHCRKLARYATFLRRFSDSSLCVLFFSYIHSGDEHY